MSRSAGTRTRSSLWAGPQDPNVDGEGMKLDVTVMDQHHRDQLRGQREELETVPRNFCLRERDFESQWLHRGLLGVHLAAQERIACSSQYRMPGPRRGGDEGRQAR